MILQNKFTVAVKTSFEKARQVGGIPKVLEMTSNEFYGLIIEINKFRTRPSEYPLDNFKFFYEEQDGRMLLTAKDLNDSELINIVHDWEQGKFQIVYLKTPLTYNPHPNTGT